MHSKAMFAPTYTGYIETTEDALLVFEACRLGILQRRSRRLVESERKHVKSGSVFVWDETEAGIRRWTDGRRWSPSRVSGCFLIYTELEPKPASSSSTATDIPLENGLIKKALSLYTTNQNKLHLVCYYHKEDLDSGRLVTPTRDALLSKIPISRNLYPEVIPEMIQTLPVRQTQTVGARRSSVTLAALPVDLHHSLSAQQIQRQLTLDEQQMCRSSSIADKPMEAALSEPGYVVKPAPPLASVQVPADGPRMPVGGSRSTAAQASPAQMQPLVMPAQPPLNRRCMTTADSREELRSNLLQNISAYSAATQVPTLSTHWDQQQQPAASNITPSHPLQQQRQRVPKHLGTHHAGMSPTNTSSFRSLSHPFLLDNSDLPGIQGQGSSTTPGSRRCTIYVSSENSGAGSRRESESTVTRDFRLPPISELLRLANRKTSLKPSASVAATESRAAEKARMRYARNPWDRQSHGIGTPQSLTNYSFN